MSPLPFLVRLLARVVIAACPLLACAIEPGEDRTVDRAVFTAGRLWVLTDTGTLSSILEGQDLRIVEPLAEQALALCVHEGLPAVITAAADGTSWTLRQRYDESWAVIAVIRSDDDDLMGMDCSTSGFIVLTSRRLIRVEGDYQHVVTLHGDTALGRISSTYRTPDELFVGTGYGLHRIVVRSGQMETVCDPSLPCGAVNAITANPWKPGCIVAAFGDSNFIGLYDGQLAEVCGSRMQLLYSSPTPHGYDSWPADVREKALRMFRGESLPLGTVAFFGLARDGDTLLATGYNGLYEIGYGGAARRLPAPVLQNFAGVRVSFDLPSAVVVLAVVRDGHRGYRPIPLVVPRR